MIFGCLSPTEPSGEEAVFSLSAEPDKVFLGPRHCAAICGRELIIYTRKSQVRVTTEAALVDGS